MRTLCISDLHAPFAHPDALDFLRDLKTEIRPESVVCLGDEVDAHNFARWPRDWNAPGPREELGAARAFLRQLAKLFPILTIVDSNHTWRPWKRAAAAGLLPEMIRDRADVLGTPKGWRWVQACIGADCVYLHGEGFSGRSAAIDAATAYRRNVVIGHVHAHAGIVHNVTAGGPIWGMNAGCLMDVTQPAFAYGAASKLKPVIGTGAVLDGVPVFFPMR